MAKESRTLQDQLYDALADAYCEGKHAEAEEIAYQLLEALGDPTTPDFKWTVFHWTLAWDALGETEKAVAAYEEEISRLAEQIESGIFRDYPHLQTEQVNLLQDLYVIQAERHLKQNRHPEALTCLQSVLSLAEKFGIGPDEDAITLQNKLKPYSQDAELDPE